MGCLVTLILSVILALGGFGWWATYDLPSVETLLAQKADVNSLQSTEVFAADGSTVIFSNGAFRHKKVKLSQVAKPLQEAIVATEDRRFYSHKGVDPVSIGRAFVKNITDKGLSEGASTITQQLARTLFLTQERSMRRKFREMWLALQLEQRYSKEQILEMYLNTIYFGEGSYGVGAAAEVYYNKAASELSVAESALIAGLPQAPSRLDPFVNPKLAKARRNEVLDNLVEVGKLTKQEATRYKEQGLGLNAPPSRNSVGDLVPYYNRLVQQRVMSWYGLNEQEFWQAGFKIYTSLDLRAQRLAEQAVQEASQQFGRTRAGQEAALVALDSKTGAIIAYVGGRSYRTSQFDRASMARRSPGSLFKVITYTAALNSGFKPEDVLIDEPIHYGNWTPENYDKRHHGAMTVAQAFANSNNVIAVKLLYEVGPQAAVDLASRMGVESPLKPYLSLTLGGSSVTLMEMVGAVNTVNNQGIWTQPYVVERIVDSQNQVVYEHEPRVRDVISPTVAHTMIKLMQGVVSYGTARAANFGRPAAGKSGTSDHNKDAWFVGFTPTTIAGVWVGNDNNSPMSSQIAGGTLPATAWRIFMQRFSEPLPVKDFDTSNGDGAPATWYKGGAVNPTQEGGGGAAGSAEGVPTIELRNLFGDPDRVEEPGPSAGSPQPDGLPPVVGPQNYNGGGRPAPGSGSVPPAPRPLPAPVNRSSVPLPAPAPAPTGPPPSSTNQEPLPEGEF